MKFKIFFVFLFVALFNPGIAHAYVDPGSGMLMLQGLIAAIGACIAFIKDPIGKLKLIYRKIRGLK